MFKKIVIFLTMLSMVLVGAGTANALDLGGKMVGDAAEKAGYDQVTDTTLSQNIGGIIKTILGLTGVIFTALTVYAGILWMTAHGEEEQITKAKKIIAASIIGLAIALSAYSITAFVIPAIMGS